MTAMTPSVLAFVADQSALVDVVLSTTQPTLGSSLRSLFIAHLIIAIIMGGGHHHNPEAMPRKDQDLDAIKKARMPLGYRDTCAHLLLQLNECRRQTFFNPHKCGHQRHTYEECQYIGWLQRVDAKKVHVAKMKAAAEAEANA